MACPFIDTCDFDRLVTKKVSFESENEPNPLWKFDKKLFARMLKMFNDDSNDLPPNDTASFYDSEEKLTLEVAEFIKERLKLKEKDEAKSPPDFFSYHGIEEWLKQVRFHTEETKDLLINVLILNSLKLSSVRYHEKRYVECNAYSTVAMGLIRMVKDSTKLKYIAKYFVYYEYVAKLLTTYATYQFYKKDHPETCSCLNDFKKVWTAYGRIIETEFPGSDEKPCGPFVSLASENAGIYNLKSLSRDKPLENCSSSKITSLSAMVSPKTVSSMGLDTFENPIVERDPITDDETRGATSYIPGIRNSETEERVLKEDMPQDQSVRKSAEGSIEELENIPEDKPLEMKEIVTEKNVEKVKDTLLLKNEPHTKDKSDLVAHRNGETPESGNIMGAPPCLGLSGFHMDMADPVFNPMEMFNVNAFADSMLTESVFMQRDSGLFGNYLFVKVKRARTSIANIVNGGFNQSEANIEKLRSIAKELDGFLDQYPREYRDEHPYKMIAREFLNAITLLCGSVSTEEKGALLQAFSYEKIKELCDVISSPHCSQYILLSIKYAQLVQIVLPQFKKASDNHVFDGSYEGLNWLMPKLPTMIDEESDISQAPTPTIARIIRLSLILKISLLLPLKEYDNMNNSFKGMIKRYEKIFDEHICNNMEGLTSVMKLYLDYTYCNYSGSDLDKAAARNPLLQVDWTVKRLLYLTEVIKKYRKGANLEEETKRTNQTAMNMITMSESGGKTRSRSKRSGKSKSKKNTSLEQQLATQDEIAVQTPAPLDKFIISNETGVIEEGSDGAVVSGRRYMELGTYEDFIDLSRKHVYYKEITELIVPDISLSQNEPSENVHHSIILAITQQLEEKLSLFKSENLPPNLKTLFSEKQVQNAYDFLQKKIAVYSTLEKDLPEIMECLQTVKKHLTS